MHEILHIAPSVAKYFNSESIRDNGSCQNGVQCKIIYCIIFEQFLSWNIEVTTLTLWHTEVLVLFWGFVVFFHFLFCFPNDGCGNQNIWKHWGILKIYFSERSLIWNKRPSLWQLSFHLTRMVTLTDEFWVSNYFFKDSKNFTVVRTFG